MRLIFNKERLQLTFCENFDLWALIEECYGTFTFLS